MRASAKHTNGSAPSDPPESARAVASRGVNDTSDLSAVITATIVEVLNDEMDTKKAASVYAGAGRVQKVIELECKVAEKSGRRRVPLAIRAPK